MIIHDHCHSWSTIITINVATVPSLPLRHGLARCESDEGSMIIRVRWFFWVYRSEIIHIFIYVHIFSTKCPNVEDVFDAVSGIMLKHLKSFRNHQPLIDHAFLEASDVRTGLGCFLVPPSQPNVRSPCDFWILLGSVFLAAEEIGYRISFCRSHFQDAYWDEPSVASKSFRPSLIHPMMDHYGTYMMLFTCKMSLWVWCQTAAIGWVHPWRAFLFQLYT